MLFRSFWKIFKKNRTVPDPNYQRLFLLALTGHSFTGDTHQYVSYITYDLNTDDGGGQESYCNSRSLYMFIFQKVIEVSKEYLPEMSSSFANPRLNLHIHDGFDFMGKHHGEFDVIITDSSDPIGKTTGFTQRCVVIFPRQES